MSDQQKARSLKKYEAAPLVSLSLPADAARGLAAMDFLSPFGPMIARARLPESVLARVNRFADTQVAPDKSTEFTLPEGLVSEGGADSLGQFVLRQIARYLEGMEGSVLTQAQFDVFWAVSQYEGTSSPVHFHSGDIAGIAYLKLPQVDPAQEAKTYISNRRAGYINFLIGGKQRFSRSLISFKPAVGDFYIFPGWLLHVAEPFAGSGERRSMSFNARVTCAGD